MLGVYILIEVCITLPLSALDLVLKVSFQTLNQPQDPFRISFAVLF